MDLDNSLLGLGSFGPIWYFYYNNKNNQIKVIPVQSESQNNKRNRTMLDVVAQNLAEVDVCETQNSI